MKRVRDKIEPWWPRVLFFVWLSLITASLVRPILPLSWWVSDVKWTMPPVLLPSTSDQEACLYRVLHVPIVDLYTTVEVRSLKTGRRPGNCPRRSNVSPYLLDDEEDRLQCFPAVRLIGAGCSLEPGKYKAVINAKFVRNGITRGDRFVTNVFEIPPGE